MADVDAGLLEHFAAQQTHTTAALQTMAFGSLPLARFKPAGRLERFEHRANAVLQIQRESVEGLHEFMRAKNIWVGGL